jgi:hypothetical protein
MMVYGPRTGPSGLHSFRGRGKERLCEGGGGETISCTDFLRLASSFPTSYSTAVSVTPLKGHQMD